jgi:hypothetical protein
MIMITSPSSQTFSVPFRLAIIILVVVPLKWKHYTKLRLMELWQNTIQRLACLRTPPTTSAKSEAFFLSPRTLAHTLATVGFSVETWDPKYQIPYSWICGDFNPNPYVSTAPSAPCTLQTALNNADTWGYDSNLYAYCLVEVVPEQCSIKFSLVIMLIVIAANTTKVAVMVIVFLKFRAPTLVTLGDAVASFLNDPDPTTAGMCMSTKKDVFKVGQDLSTYPAKPWSLKRHFWFNAVSLKRWLTCNIL